MTRLIQECGFGGRRRNAQTQDEAMLWVSLQPRSEDDRMRRPADPVCSFLNSLGIPAVEGGLSAALRLHFCRACCTSSGRGLHAEGGCDQVCAVTDEAAGK